MARLYHPKYSRDLFFLLLLVYVSVQCVFIFQVIHYFPGGLKTENYYSPLAAYLATNGWPAVVAHIDGSIAETFGFPPTFRPPLFTFVLAAIYALFGPHEIYGLILNNAALTTTVILVHRIGARLSQAAGLIAPLFMVLDPIFLAEANSNQSDTLFMFFMVLFAYFMVRLLPELPKYHLIVGASVALTLAIFTRNAGLYMPVAAALVMCISYWKFLPLREVTRVVIVFLIVASVPIGGWMMRNQTITGNPDFAGGSTGTYLYGFFVPHILSIYNGTPPSEIKRQLAQGLAEDSALQNASRGELERHKVREVVRTVVDYPVTTVLVLLDNLPKLFLSYPFEVLAVFADEEKFIRWQHFDAIALKQTYDRSNWAVQSKLNVVRYYADNGLLVPLVYGFFSKGLNALILVLSVIGFYHMLRNRDRSIWTVGWFLLFYVGLLTAIAALVAAARFRLPITPILFLVAAYAVDYFWERYRSRVPHGETVDT